jgi:Tol biopolymer transport system component
MIARVLLPVAAALLVWAAGAAALPEARNGLLAFASAGDIWVVDPDGENLEPITQGPARDVYPTWSPEGTRIVFSSNRGRSRDLWIMEADGGGLRRLTRNRGTRAQDSAPTISPDGRRLAFARRLRGNQEIYVMNLDGTGLRRLTRFPGIDFDPAWSPDGTQIAFWRALRRARRTVHQVFAIDADGTNLRQLTWGASSDAPSWSPDGSKIAFTRTARARGDIWTMRADGTGQQRVTGGVPHDDDSVWAPDGSAIAFSSDRNEGTPNLYIVSLRTPRRVVRVTKLVDSGYREAEGAVTPAWQPVMP